MDIVDAIVLEIDQKASQIRDHLSAGRAASFEEYKALCGEIKGLLFTRQYALDLKRKMENSDDE